MGRFVKLWQILVVGPILIGLGIWEYDRLGRPDVAFETADRIYYRDWSRYRIAVLILIAAVVVVCVRAIAAALEAGRVARQRAETAEELADPNADARAQRRAAKEEAARQRRAAAQEAARQRRPVRPDAAPDGHPFRAAPQSVVIVQPERPRTAPVVKAADASDDGPAILK